MHISEITASASVSAIIARADLTAALPIVLEAIDKRTPLPVLSMVRIRADGAGAVLSGTDLDCEISVRIPGAVDSRMDCHLYAHKLSELLKKAPKAECVEITQGEDTAALDFEKVTYRVPSPTFAEDDLPAALAFNASHSFTMGGAELREHIAAVSGAISTEETRYYLNGIYMHVRPYDDVLTFVATDGHRLYRQDAGKPEGVDGMPGVIIPAATVATFLKLTKGKACPAEVAVSISESRVAFRFGDVSIASKVIDGTFPDYMRCIPRHNGNTAEIDTAALQESLAGVMAITDTRGATVRMVFGDEIVSLHAADPETGTARTDCPVSLYEGDPMEIGFSGKYVADILALCGKTTRIALADCSSPAVFLGDRADWLAVLMPKRV